MIIKASEVKWCLYNFLFRNITEKRVTKITNEALIICQTEVSIMSSPILFRVVPMQSINAGIANSKKLYFVFPESMASFSSWLMRLISHIYLILKIEKISKHKNSPVNMQAVYTYGCTHGYLTPEISTFWLFYNLATVYVYTHSIESTKGYHEDI